MKLVKRIFFWHKCLSQNRAVTAGVRWHIQASFCSGTLQISNSSYSSACFCLRSCYYGYKVGGMSYPLCTIWSWWAMRCRRQSASKDYLSLQVMLGWSVRRERSCVPDWAEMVQLPGMKALVGIRYIRTPLCRHRTPIMGCTRGLRI